MGYTKSHALKTAIHETVNRIKISATKRNSSSQSETAITSKIRQISHQQKRCTAGKFQPSLQYTLMCITIPYFSFFAYIQFLFFSKHDLSLSAIFYKKREQRFILKQNHYSLIYELHIYVIKIALSTTISVCIEYIKLIL